MASIVIPGTISVIQAVIAAAGGTYIFSNIGKLLPGFVPKTSAINLSAVIADARKDIDANSDPANVKAWGHRVLDKLAANPADINGALAA
jgi:hypothetical protein